MAECIEYGRVGEARGAGCLRLSHRLKPNTATDGAGDDGDGDDGDDADDDGDGFQLQLRELQLGWRPLETCGSERGVASTMAAITLQHRSHNQLHKNTPAP